MNLFRIFGESTNFYIYSTSYNRTRETAKPLSEATGRPIIEYDRSDMGALADALVLVDGPKCVIGHSVSTLELLKKLTGIDGSPLNENTEFDRMYIFETPFTSADELLQIRCGEA